MRRGRHPHSGGRRSSGRTAGTSVRDPRRLSANTRTRVSARVHIIVGIGIGIGIGVSVSGGVGSCAGRGIRLGA